MAPPGGPEAGGRSTPVEMFANPQRAAAAAGGGDAARDALSGARNERDKAKQFQAVLRKNYRLKTRGCLKCCTVTEIVLPTVFFLLMCLPRYFIEDFNYHEQFNRELAMNVPPYDWDTYCVNGHELAVSPDTSAATAVGQRAVQSMVCGKGLLYDLRGDTWTWDDTFMSGVVGCGYYREAGEDYTPPWIEAERAMNLKYDELCKSACILNETSCGVDGGWDGMYDLFLKTFPTAEDAVGYSQQNPLTVLAAVAFEGDTTGEDVRYALRLNGTDWGSKVGDVYVTKWEAVSPPWERAGVYYSFTVIQNAIDQALLSARSLAAGNGPVILEVTAKMAPWLHYVVNWGGVIAGAFFGFLGTLSFTSTTVLVLKSIVAEKELKLREGMQMMGLSTTMYWTSWFVSHLIPLSLTSVLCAIIGIYPFRYSNPFLTFAFFLVWSCALILFNYALSTLFDRSRMASIVGAFVYITTMVPAIVAHTTSEEGGAGWIWCCLLPASAMYQFGAVMQFVEGSQLGLQFDNMSDDLVADGFSGADVFGVTLLSCFVYGFLAWYLDKVMPSQWGVKLPPWFLFMPSYWRGTPVALNAEEGSNVDRDIDNPNVEPLTATQEANVAVRVRGLGKKFANGVTAVDGLSFDFASGQISALLGHNGAGKTTTISMLTGSITPTYGDALVNGHSIATEMGAIRSSLGICPQFDVLWPELSVREHLELYAAFAGVPAQDIPILIQQRVREVGLEEKMDAPAGTLSGGQKRKLSVAIAFLGDPKCVFLDEPTSGMDPYSRRFTWDVIRNHRESCAVLLTTHFLDEADTLCDRIAIMSAGRMACAGSSVFLKNRFGAGYHIVFALGESSNSEMIAATVRQHVPQAKLASEVGSELAFTMPTSSTSAFAPLIRHLDSQKESLGFTSYGVSCTTLEEVFLEIAKSESGKLPRVLSKQASRTTSNGTYHAINVEDEPESANLTKHVTGWWLLAQQLRALLIKRLLNWKRDKRGALVQTIVPALFLILALAIAKIDRTDDESAYGSMTLSRALVANKPAPLGAAPGMQPEAEAALASALSTGAMVDTDATTLAECDCFCFSKWQQDEGEHSYGCPMYGSPPTCVDSADGVTTTQTCASSIDTTLDAYVAERQESLTPCQDESKGSCDALFVHSYPDISSASTGLLEFRHAVMPNPTAYHALPVSVNTVNSAIMNVLQGGQGGITVTNHPLPNPKASQAGEEEDSGGNGIELSVGIFMNMGCSVLSAGYSVYLVWERSNNAKHLQMVSGVNKLVFWLSNWIADQVAYSISLAIFMIIFVAMDTDQYSGDGLAAAFVLLLFFGLAAIPLSYVVHFGFRTETNALAGQMTLYGITGFAFLLAAVILEDIAADSNSSSQAGEAWKVLKYIFRLLPHYCLSKGMYDIGVNANKDKEVTFDPSTGTFSTVGADDPFKMDITGTHLLFLAIEAAVFSILTIVIESGEGSFSKAITSSSVLKTGPPPPAREGEEDDDVQAERGRVGAARASELTDAVVVQELTKTYFGGKSAVRGLSWGVPTGTCFGLLGINGAGKTTTFKMLTGEFPPSSGDAFVKGRARGGPRATYSVTTELDDARQLIGYCPQFDGIHPNLTGEELLRLYARVRGTPEGAVQAAVDGLIDRMQLQKYASRVCGTYSGGNKRKLSVAIALVGDPQVVLLDEPSTGMDPQARRFMWDVISSSLQGRAVVLTSHSMEECEALCHSVGIMVTGRFRCLGSVQHLKAKYGSGYYLTMRIKPENVAAARAWAENGSALPGASLVEAHETQLKYQLPGGDLGIVFEALEAVRTGAAGAWAIEDYAVSQTTLEQVFVRFAAEQSEERVNRAFEQQHLPAPAPMPAPGENKFAIVVPDGLEPGAVVAVTVPQGFGEATGKTLHVTLPPGSAAGQRLELEVPPGM